MGTWDALTTEEAADEDEPQAFDLGLLSVGEAIQRSTTQTPALATSFVIAGEANAAV